MALGRELAESWPSLPMTKSCSGPALESCLEIQKSVLLPALAELPAVGLSNLALHMDALLTGKELGTSDELDVREIPRGQRHPASSASRCGSPKVNRSCW
ncbi:hypothetical protein Amsp01_088570 [Amycolatopsis sp. NBRC 101858]|nr:hypothetical protein Amsp01_088570 [Amycolatopsis sp. NBRC 101858]